MLKMPSVQEIKAYREKEGVSLSVARLTLLREEGRKAIRDAITVEDLKQVLHFILDYIV